MYTYKICDIQYIEMPDPVFTREIEQITRSVGARIVLPAGEYEFHPCIDNYWLLSVHIACIEPVWA